MGASKGRRLFLDASSGKQITNHLAMDVGQPIPAALVFEDQPLMVDAQQVHQRRLEVVYVHRVAGDVVAEFVRLTIGKAWLDAAPVIQRVKQRGWWSRPKLSSVSWPCE